MKDVTPADTLEAAAKLLERDGWCQFSQYYEGRRCAAGAISDVSAWRFHQASPVLEAYLGQMVTVWNDADDQTASNVVQTMRACAKDYRKRAES